MPLENRADFIRDMIDKRIGPVSMLLYIGHDHASQWRDVLRVAGHAEILSDEIDVKGCPLRIPHEGLHRKAGTAGTCQWPWRADLEAEPVANLQGGRPAQVRLCNFPGHLAVQVNVDSPPDADVTGEQRCRAFDDPALIDEVEALQQPVVRHLPLELLERPAALGGENPELVGESPPEGTRASV
jgi:hypothetical protein